VGAQIPCPVAATSRPRGPQGPPQGYPGPSYAPTAMLNPAPRRGAA